MVSMRDKAIAKSDELWPDFGDGVSHGLSGGFVEGAVWADQAPAGDLEAELLRRFPVREGLVDETITDRWRRGFKLGAEWVRESSSTDAQPETPAEKLQHYLGTIFSPGRAEGVELEVVLHSDLESLRAMLKAAVDEANLDESEDSEPFSWQDEGETYWPERELPYGSFVWARVQPIVPGYRQRVSEFS